MQRTKHNHLANIFLSSPAHMLFSAVVVLALAGCRNTTTTPISPLGGSAALSPLAPVQGAATLSPLQPTSGISTFGAPTRVPPPPTGSYNPPGSYGSTSSFNAPTSNYAPTGSAPSGATLGSNGLTRGVTDLNSSFDSGVRQTGWVADPNVGGATFGPGTDPRLNSAAATTAPTNPSSGPRTGGMQVIDLTRSPYPPGYVPPQNRPGAGTLPQSVPFPPANAAPTTNPLPASSAPLGQPTNSTFVRTAGGSSGVAGFSDAPSMRTANRSENVLLPSTEPFPGDQGNSDEQLQWRRPSPRF